jgi:hypothetical protein
MVGRAGQRALIQRQAPGYVDAPLSKRGYGILATAASALCAVLGILNDRDLGLIRLGPASACIWLAVYLLRGT